MEIASLQNNTIHNTCYHKANGIQPYNDKLCKNVIEIYEKQKKTNVKLRYVHMFIKRRVTKIIIS